MATSDQNLMLRRVCDSDRGQYQDQYHEPDNMTNMTNNQKENW